jgi:hypothetical protein
LYDVEWGGKTKKRSAPCPGPSDGPTTSRQTEAVLRGFGGERTLALTPGLYRMGRSFSPLLGASGASLRRGESLLATTVSEIHRYPSRPPRFEEPLFPTRESRRAVAEHLASAPWLSRGSALDRGSGQAAHSREEPAHVLRRADGRAYLVRRSGKGLRTRKRRVVLVLERWREVGPWWDAGGGVDRLVFRVLLAGGAVVDLALERASREWLVVGVVD